MIAWSAITVTANARNVSHRLLGEHRRVTGSAISGLTAGNLIDKEISSAQREQSCDYDRYRDEIFIEMY
jgi:hypothetical protein